MKSFPTSSCFSCLYQCALMCSVHNQVRELMFWMSMMMREMNAQEKPRDVSGVHLLISNHQSLKAEIDAREENFSICITLGRNLLQRKHFKSEEVLVPSLYSWYIYLHVQQQ